jgi:hypothetical protein
VRLINITLLFPPSGLFGLKNPLFSRITLLA